MQKVKPTQTKHFIAIKADSFYHGIGIYQIKHEYGEDYAYFAEETDGKKGRIHKSKIRYNQKGSPFFILRGKREYIGDYIKLN